MDREAEPRTVMEEMCLCSRDASGVTSRSSPPSSSNNIFSLKFSDLPNSRYSYFLHAFTDESDFEEFKKDLHNFQKLKRNCSPLNNSSSSNNNNNNSSSKSNNNNDNSVTNHSVCKQEDSENELNEDLQIICRQNTARKTRRKTHLRGSYDKVESKELNYLQKASTQNSHTGDSEHDTGKRHSEPLVQINRDIPQQTQKSSDISTNNPPWPDSFALRGDFERRSYAYGYDRRSGLRSSINDLLMEFINGDEHFREFERVFETVNNRKNTRERNGSSSRRMSSYRENVKGPQSPDRLPSNDGELEGHVCASRSTHLIDDTLTDFFDNDEDFLAFEKELEQFRANRLSKYYGSISSLGSSKDIFGDMKSYCDRSLSRLESGSVLSVNSCASAGEVTPSCSADDPRESNTEWKSVDYWEKMLKKMRRNSRLMSDSKYQANKRGHHRHSMYGLSKPESRSEQYQKTQSLADIPGHCSESSSTSHLTSTEIEKDREIGVKTTPVGEIQRLPSIDKTLERQTAAYDSNDSDANSCDIWSDSYVDDGDIRYSSSSTLCSSHDDSTSFSPSCSCSSDLHINEDTDEDFAFSSSPATRQRSQSFHAVSKARQKPDIMAHSGSLKNWSGKGRDSMLSDLPTSSQSQPSFLHLQPSCPLCRDAVLGHRCSSDPDKPHSSPFRQTCDLTGSADFHEHIDSDCRWESESGNQLSESSSLSSLHLTDDVADDESDQFHSAKSDFSEHFHTAKSDFPAHRRQSGYFNRPLAAGHRSQSADLAGLSSLETADRGSRVDAWLTTDQEAAGARHDCQYTCHQLCVPSVNLNCKTISDDGDDVTQAKAQPERKGSLETSLSLGIQARPGAAKILPRGASEDGTSCTLAAQHIAASESTPNLQQIGRPQHRAMPTSQPIIDSLANALGFDCLDVSDLPKLPPPPSAIDELTVDNDDSRFITHGQHLQHRHSLPHAPTYSPISEEDQREVQNAKTVSSSTWTMTKTSPRPTIVADHPSSLSTSTSVEASQKTSHPRDSTPPQTEKSADSETPCQTQTQIIHDGVKLESEAHAEEKDETDSGYRSGTIPDEKLPKVPSQATLDRQDLKRKITKYNHFVPTVHLEMMSKESFQGFLKVCMNLIRPITMELGARPPSIYELLTKEHIIEENTQQVAFYMPRDTYKSLHISSETTTKELVALLLKKFHILDHPRKFAMYEQEFNDNNKLVRLRRLGDKDHPLCAALAWNPERFHNYRMVLQENETGEIVWDAFSLPELNNFLKVLDREEKETIMELRHKYAYMRQLMEKRLIEFRGGKRHSKVKSTSQA